MVDGVLRVSIPAVFTAAEEAEWVAKMRSSVLRKRRAGRIDLASRARRLAARHQLPVPDAISWSERQRTLWGSCTPGRGTVRIATRVAQFPDWVVDYVIVHELAHLAVPDHSAAFWAIVDRYPLAERARGYLLAKEELADREG